MKVPAKIMSNFSFLLLLPLCCNIMAADDNSTNSQNRIHSALLQVKADIERDTAELNSLRAEIDRERKPLADELERLQKSVTERRAEAERIRLLQRQDEKEQTALLNEAAAIKEESRFIMAVCTEYARAMETRAGAAEAFQLAEQLAPARIKLEEEDEFSGLAGKVEQLFSISSAWNKNRLGGYIFKGSALDKDGTEYIGHFAACGPVAWFAAQEGTPAGLAVTQSGTDQPAVYQNLPVDVAEEIKHIIAGRQAYLPLDVTGGDAIKVRETRVSLAQHLKQGGFVMIPLFGVGIVALVLVIWKTVELSTVRAHGGAAAGKAIALARKGDFTGAEKIQLEMREPLASLVREALRHHNSPRDHLEEILHEHVLGTLPGLERHLGTLAVLGGIAPLLGLLGTVTGMIHTFQLVTVFGSGDARLLSGGISEALVTTEFGLAIAIPVLLAHAFLARRARVIIGMLEQTALSMVNDLKIRTDDLP